MNRRKLLGLLGVTVASGPKAVANLTTDSLTLGGVQTLGGVVADSLGGGEPGYGSSDGQRNWAKRMLKRLADPHYLERRRKNMPIHALDADTAALRSVSLVRKIERTRRLAFESYKVDQKSYMERVLLGDEEGWD